MSILNEYQPIRFFTGVLLLTFLVLAGLIIADDFIGKSSSLTGKQSTDNEEAAEPAGSIDSSKFSSKTDDYNFPGETEVYGSDDTLQVNFVKATKPSPRDPLLEDAPAPLTPTQPISPDDSFYDNQIVQNSEKDDVAEDIPEIQIGTRKQLLCLDMAIAGVIVAGFIVMFVSLLHSLVEWLIEGHGKPSVTSNKPRIFHIPFLAKLDPETKSMVFDKMPQIHKV